MSQFRDAVYSSPAVDELLSPAAHVTRLLEVEAALAQALATTGRIPSDAADRIASVCTTGGPDPDQLARDTATAGTPVIPLVRWLRDRVGEADGRFVHMGATSQDIVDTAMVLRLRAGIAAVVSDLWVAAERCHDLAIEHRATPIAGRTLLQQAVPIAFGLKAARWLDSLLRSIERLHGQAMRELVLQFGGAAGSLAAYGTGGPEVAQALGAELDLDVPPVPWHGERDRVGAVAAALAVTAGTAGSIARDLVLLSQTEVGEVRTASPGGSSAMPHKQNPIDPAFAVAAARLAAGVAGTLAGTAVQDHERDAGGWQAEWVALPDVLRYTAGACYRCTRALREARVDAARMRANLEAQGGLVMAESLTTALAGRLGQVRAGELVGRLSHDSLASGRPLREVALADAKVREALGGEEVASVFDPQRALGSSDYFIGAVRDRYLEVRDRLRPAGLP